MNDTKVGFNIPATALFPVDNIQRICEGQDIICLKGFNAETCCQACAIVIWMSIKPLSQKVLGVLSNLFPSK